MTRQPTFAPLGVSLVILAIMLFAPQVLNDADTFWHLKAGEWMIDHRAVIHADPFSFTRSGTAWNTHEWLSEVIMAAAYKLAGWNGVLVLAALFAAAAAAIVGWRVSRSLSGLAAFLVLVLGMACMSGSLLVRPHILGLPFLALWTVMLLRARDRDEAPPLWGALLVVVWANLHGGYVLGYVLAAAFALEALIAAAPEKRRTVIMRWGAFGLLSLAASAATPHGLEGLIHPFKLMTMTTLPFIAEWRPMDFSRLHPLELAIIATIFFAFTRGLVAPPVRVLLLLFLLHMAFQHARHALVIGLIAPMLLAEPIANSLGQTPQASTDRRPAQLAVAIALVLVCLRLALPVAWKDGATRPEAALASVPAALRSEPVLNSYDFGGYLIFEGVKPYIDGRADMYGDAFVRAYFEMMAPDAERLRRDLVQRDIAWTLLAPSEKAVRVLDAMPDWSRAYADEFAVIHIRRPQPAISSAP